VDQTDTSHNHERHLSWAQAWQLSPPESWSRLLASPALSPAMTVDVHRSSLPQHVLYMFQKAQNNDSVNSHHHFHLPEISLWVSTTLQISIPDVKSYVYRPSQFLIFEVRSTFLISKQKNLKNCHKKIGLTLKIVKGYKHTSWLKGLIFAS
jgi:hypothetical protein